MDRGFYITEPAAEIQKKLNRSYQETVGLAIRDIRCPYCGFLIDRLYSDAVGHKESKCRKCKRIVTYNMAYFRQRKRRRNRLRQQKLHNIR